MTFTYVMIILSTVGIFCAGYIFYEKIDDVGPLFILPLLAIFALCAVIMIHFEKETTPIHSASVHQAIVLCETNGGLKTLDQREAVCENGVTFNTRSLKLPEKE